MIVVYSPSGGRILRVIDAPDAEAAANTRPGEAFLLTTANASDATHWVNAGALAAYTEAARTALANYPGAGFDWSPAAGRWIDNRTLAKARADAWGRIKARREVAFAARAVSSAGIAYAIAADKANLADRLASLQAAIAIGAANASTVISWRDRDNAERALMLAGLNLLAAEMGARGQAIYEHSWALDAQVQAAASKQAIDAIDLEVGWP